MSNIDVVLAECTAYIQGLRQGKKGCFLVRSVHEDIDIQRRRHSTRHRTPRNMDKVVHEEVNEHFLKTFKWAVRNGVFCFGVSNPSHTMKNLGYGRSHLLFPCGELNYVCDTDIFDLYEHYRSFFSANPKAEISEFIESIHYSDSNLQFMMSQISRYDRSTEIIINCEYYYLVNLKYVEELINRIWQHPRPNNALSPIP